MVYKLSYDSYFPRVATVAQNWETKWTQVTAEPWHLLESELLIKK